MSNSTALCRTCLKEKGVFPLTYTTRGYEDIDFSVMLMLCTSISIEPEDDLPHLICEKCVTTLVVSYSFKQQCERSDLFLRSRVSLDNFKDITVEIKSKKNEHSEKQGCFIQENNENQYLPKDFDVKSEISDNETIEEANHTLENKITVENLFVVKDEDIENDIKNDDDNLIISCKLDENESFNYKSKKSKKYQCPQCDKQFTTRYGLQYHLKQHSGAKNYICPIEKCKRKFFWEPALKRHMQTHSDEKKYLCYLCGKGYTAADSLRYHIINHKGERPHLCTQCGKTFKQHIHLKYHMSSHNDERTHVCSKCNRSYLGVTQLRKHWKNYCGIGKEPPPKRKTTHFKELL